VRTERALFERCLTELPELPEEEAAPAPAAAVARFNYINFSALAVRSAESLVQLARELAVASSRPGLHAQELSARLGATIQELADRALRAGLSPVPSESHEAGDTVLDLSKLAEDLDHVSPAHRQTARWLRGRALALLARIAALGPSPFAAGEQHAQAARGEGAG